MITRITGVLNRVLDEEARLQVGGLEYQVLVPEFVRRNLQGRIGQEVSLSTVHFLEGNPMQGKVVPRLIGFTSDTELEFFELFCTVDKIGTRKALKALARPIRDIADAIQRQDAKYLTTLPGVGAPTAEKIVATLKRKVTRYALAPKAARAEGNGEATAEEPAPTAVVSPMLIRRRVPAATGITPRWVKAAPIAPAATPARRLRGASGALSSPHGATRSSRETRRARRHRAGGPEQARGRRTRRQGEGRACAGTQREHAAQGVGVHDRTR